MGFQFHIKSDGTSTGSRIGSAVFGLIFAGMGLLFLGILGWVIGSTLSTILFWKAAPCTIEVCRTVPNTKGEDGFELRYRYQWQGKAYTGKRYNARLDVPNDSDHQDVIR
ncbi:MAG: hypothetical protein ACYTGH_19680, partial [Planctomycetota bacterium]